MHTIDYTENPTLSDLAFLTKKISEETPEYGQILPFGFFTRNDKGRMIAGVNGFILYGKIYTDQLWVAPEHREQGLARELMEKTHQLGRDRHCSMATLSTMSFQHAVGFYEKLGYTQDFERLGHINKSACIFMSKAL